MNLCFPDVQQHSIKLNLWIQLVYFFKKMCHFGQCMIQHCLTDQQCVF